MTALGIFAKRPIPGRAKTRLARSLGADAAAALAQAFLTDTLARFRATADRRIIAYAPGDRETEEYFRNLSGSQYELWPQPDGSLGVRLNEFFTQTCADNDRVAVIGSDSPTLPVEFVEQALERLSEWDCVLGPSSDGGYCLLALRKPEPSLFADIAWDSSQVLEQTIERIRAAGLTMHSLPVWYDVDTIEDLRMLRDDLSEQSRAGGPTEAPQTWAAIREIEQRGDL